MAKAQPEDPSRGQREFTKQCQCRMPHKVNAYETLYYCFTKPTLLKFQSPPQTPKPMQWHGSQTQQIEQSGTGHDAGPQRVRGPFDVEPTPSCLLIGVCRWVVHCIKEAARRMAVIHPEVTYNSSNNDIEKMIDVR